MQHFVIIELISENTYHPNLYHVVGERHIGSSASP